MLVFEYLTLCVLKNLAILFSICPNLISEMSPILVSPIWGQRTCIKYLKIWTILKMASGCLRNCYFHILSSQKQDCPLSQCFLMMFASLEPLNSSKGAPLSSKTITKSVFLLFSYETVYKTCRKYDNQKEL